MPMNFPDMKSLLLAADAWKFRKPNEGESEDEYRIALAEFVAPQDMIESMEIRNKVGWDQWNDAQNLAMLMRAFSGAKTPPRRPIFAAPPVDVYIDGELQKKEKK